jgi:hypothetical protein
MPSRILIGLTLSHQGHYGQDKEDEDGHSSDGKACGPRRWLEGHGYLV